MRESKKARGVVSLRRRFAEWAGNNAHVAPECWGTIWRNRRAGAEKGYLDKAAGERSQVFAAHAPRRPEE